MGQGSGSLDQTPGALRLDVRGEDGYAGGHVPGRRNGARGTLQQGEVPADAETPLFVYCLSGARSRQAALILRQAGYAHVTDLGGICNYYGKVVK